MRVQNAAYAYIAPALWPLFDATGPHRPAAFGNPSKHPSEMTAEELEKFQKKKDFVMPSSKTVCRMTWLASLLSRLGYVRQRDVDAKLTDLLFKLTLTATRLERAVKQNQPKPKP